MAGEAMRIDDLAERAGVPTRTIRYYTQQGLLQPPALKGRVGYYDERHLDRLRLIRELREKRFLPLAVIRSVVKHYEAGADLDTMLAPLDIVFAPQWDASEFTREELAAEAHVDPAIVDAAQDMGFLFPQRRGRESFYTQDDLHMLALTKEWIELGIPRSLGRLYRSSLEEISRMQVRAFNEGVVEPAASEGLTPEETRQRILDGYGQMSRVFTQLVALLHRKLLQKAVESFATDPRRDA